jgi:hypothetical protein
MQRARRISIVPTQVFIEEILPKTISNINMLRFFQADVEVNSETILETLRPAYEEIAGMLSRYFGAEVKWTELRGLHIENSLVHGRLVVFVHRIGTGDPERYNIELVPVHTEGTLIERCVGSMLGSAGAISARLSLHEKIASEL